MGTRGKNVELSMFVCAYMYMFVCIHVCSKLHKIFMCSLVTMSTIDNMWITIDFIQ